MNRPAVSVVIPSYAGEHRIGGLLQTLRHQTFTGDWEAVVVLDGVVDDSRSVVESFDDLPVRVVELRENRGRPAALNAGFAAATGEVLVRCDDDLAVAPTYLATHVAAHTGSRARGAIGLCHDVLEDSAYARCYGRPANERLRAAAYALPPERWWKYWAANCSVTRETFEQVGGYDESFRAYGWEDVDWGYRLHLAGVPVRLDPHLEVLHLAASSSAEIRVKRAYLGGRAHARFDRKHGLQRARPDASGPAQRLWRTGVETAGRGASAARLEHLSRAVDRGLERVPGRLGARAVAFLVEAASLAGYADASTED